MTPEELREWSKNQPSTGDATTYSVENVVGRAVANKQPINAYLIPVAGFGGVSRPSKWNSTALRQEGYVREGDLYVFKPEPPTPPDDGGKKPVPPAREPEAQTLQSKTPSSDVSGREAPVSRIPKGARVATTKLDSGVSYRGEFVKDNGDGTATLRAFGEKPKTGLFRRYGTDAKGVQIVKDVTVPLASVKSVEPPADLGKLTPAQRSAVRRAAKAQEAAMEAEIAAGETAGADVAGRMAGAEERRERARTDNETMFRTALKRDGYAETDNAFVTAPRFRIDAYHGSPHIFDKFDLSRVGTGEGTQAYGWGLYMAQARKVAEGYRRNLSANAAPNAVTTTEDARSTLESARAINPQLVDSILRLAEIDARTNGSSASNNADDWARIYRKDGNTEAANVFSKLKSDLSYGRTSTSKGALYTVEIDADDADMLDWDVPLSQQSEKVRAALRNQIMAGDIPEQYRDMIYDAVYGKATMDGKDLYNLLSGTVLRANSERTSNRNASEFLYARGIPGIRYFDAQSRTVKSVAEVQQDIDFAKKRLDYYIQKGADQRLIDGARQDVAKAESLMEDAQRGRTYNYVIFDDSLIRITKRNDQPAKGYGPRGETMFRVATEKRVNWINKPVNAPLTRQDWNDYREEERRLTENQTVAALAFIRENPVEAKRVITQMEGAEAFARYERMLARDTMFRVTPAGEQLQQTEGTENEQRNVADRFDLPAITLPDSIQREMQGSHREKLAEDLRGVHRQYQKDLADDGEEALAEKYSEKVQEELRRKEEGVVEDYVTRNGLFIPPSSFFDKHDAYKAIVGTARSGGMENTIYVSPEDPGTVVKMNNMTRYTSWLDFLNNLAVHNFLFPETAYELVGFTRVEPAVANAPIGWNSISLRPVLKQAFVDGSRAAQQGDMKRAMGEKGFTETTEGSGTYTSDLYPGVVVSDLHDGNGIVAADGTVIVFDPAIQTTREFSTVNFRVSQPVTPAEDAEYMAAVEAGDMNKAQSMVDEAAKRAGASDNDTRTKVADLLSQRGATVDANVSSRIYNSKILDPVVESIPVDVVDLFGSRQAATEMLLNNPAMFENTLAIAETNQLVRKSALAGFRDKAVRVATAIRTALADSAQTPFDRKVFAAMHALQNNLITTVRHQSAIGFGGGLDTFRGIENTRLAGDGITGGVAESPLTALNVAGEFLKLDATNFADAFRFHKTENSKSLKDAQGLSDPITRDDQGNVISLSQRFNEATPDIRFRVDQTETAPSVKGGRVSRSVSELRSLWRKTKLLTPQQARAILGEEVPEYLTAVSDFIMSQRRKAINGEFTDRDVVKAYLMTIGSIGSDAISLDTFFRKTGLSPDESFLIYRDGKPYIRPEEAVAFWFKTPDGQAALDEVSSGMELKPDAFDGLVKMRDAYGRNDIRNNALSAKSSKRNVFSIGEITKAINNAKGDTSKISEAVRSLAGIGPAKEGFIKHLLGFGDTPTTDIVEINFWMTGKGSVRGVETSAAKRVRTIRDEGALSNPQLSQEITDRISKRIKDVASSYNLPSETAAHVVHHWLWDRAKGTETTHAGLMEAQTRFRVDQTETPEFKRWFGDSKVVDADGKPLVVYHGTNADFNVFDPRIKNVTPYSRDDHALGFFFANVESFAGKFGKNTMPVYLSLQNPYEITYDEYLKELDELGSRAGERMQRQLLKDGHDGVIITGWNPRTVMFVAFRPEQIKSATGNVGTFDSTNPDIRFRVSQPQDAEDLARAHAQFAALRALMDKPPEDFYKAKGEPDTPIVAPVVLDRKGLEEIAKATGTPLQTPAHVSQKSEVRDALADYSEDFVRSAMDRINREGRPIETNDTVAKIREFERRRLQDAEVAAVEMDTAIRNGNVGRQLALLDEKEALVRDLDQAAQALSLVGSERGRQLAFLKYGLDRNLSVIYRLQKLRKASGAPVTLEQYEKMVAEIARDKAEMKKLAEEHERVVAEVEKETRAKSIKEVEERMNKEVLAAYRKGAEAERSAFETILAMNDNPLGRMLDYAVARPDTADVPFRTAGERKENEFPQRLREIARAAWNATNGLGWAPFGVEFMKNAKAAGFNASVADAYLYDFARRMGVPVLAKPAEKWKPAAPKMEASDPKKEASAAKRRERAVKEAVRLAVAENMLADGYRIAQIASEKLVGENDFTTEWGYLTPYEIMEIVTGYPTQPEIDTRDELTKRASMVRRHMLAQLRMEELNSLKYPTKMSLPADKPDVTLRQLARELRDRMNDFQFPAGQEDERLLNAERALASRLRYAVEELQKAVDAGTPINEKAPRAVAETPEIADLRRTLKDLRDAYEALPAVEAIKEARDAERARRAANKRYHFWKKRAEDAKNGIFPKTSKANTTAERDAEAADYAKKAEAARREYWAIKKASPQERVRVMSEKVSKAEERLADLEAKLALPVAPDPRTPKKPEAAPASPEEAALARTLAERRAAIERVKKAISARWREENADAIAAAKEAERYQFLVAKAEMLEDRIRRGDFSKAPVRPRVWSARIAEVDRKVRGALRAINERIEWEANAAAGIGGKIQNYRVKGREVYKFFKTGGDLSAVGVQSARLFGYDPIYGTKLIWETAKNAWTDEAALMYQEEMHNDVDYDIAFEAGLALDQNYEDIFGTGMGESFVRDLERWGTGPGKGVGKRLVGGTARVGLASQRAFEMYGRMIRFHVFKSIINDPAHANLSKDELRTIANMVNIKGGVGNTKFYYRDIASVMSRLMWSSRLFTAQWQTLTGGGGLLWNAGMARETSRAKLGRKWYQTAAPGALKLYSRSLAGTVALSWVFGSIGMLLGDRQPWEDEETMFWKAFDFLFGRRTIGSKGIDTFGGLTSYTALVKRAFKGSHVTMSGKTQPDDDWKAWAQTFANFARGRLRPDISLALSAVFGEDVTGQPFGPRGGAEGMKNLAIEAAFPITPGDMYETIGDIWKTHGVVGVTFGLVPALASDLFGFSKGSAPRDPRYEINRHKAHLGQVRKALKEYQEAPDQQKLEAYQALAVKYSFDRGVEESIAALDRAGNTADKIAKDTKRPEAQRTEAAKAAKLYWEKARDILRASR